MHVWRCGLRPDLLREVRRFPDLIFRPQNHQKRLEAGLRPDLLGELERSPRPRSTVGAMEWNILAAVWARCGEEGWGMESTLEEEKLMRRTTSKSIIARDFVSRSKCMFGGRAS